MSEFEEFDDLDELNEEDYPTISMYDDEGNEQEFVIISSVEDGGINYLLVVEGGHLYDEESEASVLKEVSEKGQDAFYSAVEDDDEFEKVVKLFQNNSEDYDLEI